MADTNENVEKVSRIVYVDPNDIYGYSGMVPITPPYEDLSIAFNLVVEKYSRYDNNKRNTLGLCWTDKLSNDGHYNVLNGSEGSIYDTNGNRYLSTYYTDISAEGYKKKEQIEGLGVASIQVAFDNYYTPTVTIKFVDVRGCALFGREEAIHTDSEGSGQINADNIFGAFFTIPYPKFRLQIKGFYGKPVTYQLTCSNFKASFNAQTGNVEATVEFVGYTWSLLTDIPLAYLIAAPYCTYEGENYWATRIGMNNERTSWKLSNGNNPLKLFDFFQRIRGCIEEYKGTTSTEASSVANSNALLNQLRDAITRYESEAGAAGTEIPDSKRTNVTEAHNEISRLFTEYNTSHTDNPLGESLLPSEAYTKTTTPTTTATTSSASSTPTTSPSTPASTSTTTYKAVDFTELKNAISEKNNDNEQIAEDMKKEQEMQFVRQALEKIGIEPNIENIFRMIMCHLETFCHILFKCNSEIRDQYGTNERTPTALGVEFENTDIPSEDLARNLPPWTAIFNKNNATTETEETIKDSDAYQWVGDISDKWIEEKVVWSFQKAIQKLSPENNNQQPGHSKELSTIPSLPCDVNEYWKSPFDGLMSLGFSSICGHIGLRAAQILGVMDNNLDGNETIIKQLGQIDAYNFYYACDSTASIDANVLSSIKDGVGADIISGVTVCDNDCDTYATLNESGKKTHMFEQNKGSRNCKSNRQNIFNYDNNKYDYVYFCDNNNNRIVPSQLIDFQGNNYKKYVKPSAVGGDVSWEIIKEGDLVKGCLYTINPVSVDETNKDMFSIYEGDTVVALENAYKALKESNFKVRDYTVSEDFSSFLERYWHLSYDDYKKQFKDFRSLYIGKSYQSYFDNNDHKKPSKQSVISDVNVWNRALDGAQGNTSYSIGNEYGKIGEDSIDGYFVKDLCVMEEGTVVGSLFGHPLYYIQNKHNDEAVKRNAKAFLFLQSIPRSPEYFDFSFNTNHGSLGLYRKVDIFYLGGMLWRQKYFNENHKDAILTTDDGGINYGGYVDSNGNVLTIGSENGLDIKGHELTLSRYMNKENRSGWALDVNVKNQLIVYFERFSSEVFSKISTKCELKGKKGNGKYDYISSGYGLKYNLDLNYSELGSSSVLVGSNDPDLNTYYFNDYYDIMMIRKDTHKGYCLLFDETKTELQNLLKTIIFDRCVIATSGSNGRPRNGQVKISSSVYKGYLTAFIDKLKEIDENQNNDSQYQNLQITADEEVDKNLLLAIYLYCKNVWEKWLMPYSGADTPEGEQYYDVINFFDKNFIFVDSFYRKIGTLLMVNLDEVYQSYIGRSKDGNLFSFIGDIVGKHRCMFVGLPDYIDLGMGYDGRNMTQAVKNMQDVFRPMPYSQMTDVRMDNHFVVIYTQPPAKHLPDDMEYKPDCFDIYSKEGAVLPVFTCERVPDDDISTEEQKNQVAQYGYNVPSFGVAFARQNNHLFKNFNISMDNPVETEASIRTLYNVTSLAKGADRKVCFYGQDIYNIFSNYSYQIEVEMMGNAQIQPLMYFQLLNIPMWRGAYMIFNVSHSITPGNMVTKFKGMKMGSRPVPFLNKYFTFVSAQNGYGYSGGSFSGTTISTLPNLPDKINAREDYLSKSENHSNANTQQVSDGMRTLFNQLYEEIMHIEGNGDGDKSKMKWNIYATSGYRAEDNCKDHTHKGTLDVHISKWNNGRMTSVHSNGGDMREGYLVLALIRKNHMTEIMNEHVLIEYPSMASFANNKTSNAMSMLHICVNVPRPCTSRHNGPFIIAINNCPEYYSYAVDNLDVLGGINSYLSNIHPDLLAICASDYNSMSRSDFNNIWRGVIPTSASDDKLRELFNANSSANFSSAVGPDGFPSDRQLLYMLQNAESNGLYAWKDANGNLITSTGVDGYDLAGGVHAKVHATRINQTPQSCIGIPLSQVTWKFYRHALGSERGDEYEAQQNGKRINATDSYWAALVPYYRSCIKEAWSKPRAQEEHDLGTRLAKCHTMAWYYGGNWNCKFTDVGYSHRVRIAKQAIQV